MCQKEMDRKSIDALKGIGILGIVLVHYGLTTSNDIIARIVFQGARGVQLMFIINAFLIFHSLSKIELTRENIVKWWKQKFLRLIPLYWFFTILYLLVFGTGSNYFLGILPKVSLLNITANLLFLHGFYPYYINSININWFMADLALFYVVAPFLARKINSLEKAIIAVLSVSIVGYFVENIAMRLSVLEVQGIWDDYVHIMSFPAEFPIMLMGVFAYFIYSDVVKVRKIQSPRIVSFLCIFMACLLVYLQISNQGNFVIFNTIFSFGIIFFLLFVGQMIYPWKIIGNSVLALFGKHSYGVYLSHRFIIIFLQRYSLTGDADKVYIRIIGLAIVIMVSLIIAILAEQIIEKLLCGKILRLNKVK